MSFTSSHQAKVLIGPYDLSPKASSSRQATTAEMLESTTLADAAKRYVAGLGAGEYSIEGWLDADVLTYLISAPAIADLLGLDTAITYGPAGLAVGSIVEMCGTRKMATFEEGTAVGGLANFSVTVTPDGPASPGVSLHALTAETADANGTSYDRGVTSTALGAVAHLHVSAFSGLTNNIVTIEDSANNTDFTTIGTFTTVTGATQQRLYISGTIRRYVRAVWNVTGTGSCTFAVAIAPN